MWFAGLLIGALIGSLGGPVSAFFGAMVGIIAGAIIGAAIKPRAAGQEAGRLAELELKIGHIYKSLEDIHRRLVRLEQPGSLQVPETATAAAVPAASPQGPQTATDDVGRYATPAPPAATPADVDNVAAAPSDPVPVVTVAAPQPKLPSALWNFFFGGNALVRVGVIVLFFGVAFLLKYAAEHTHVPIEVRLIGVAIGAMVLLAIGWRLRLPRPGYALIMQGGGIGVLYLTVFAAFRLYQLLPSGVVFALLTAMAVFSAMLAVMQDSRSLAAVGVSGGFLAPLLASTGGGSHVMLFSFYALLNAGILAIAWYKAWRSLNLLGFAFTFVIGLLWGSRYYRPELFSSTEPFLVLFFLFYVAIAVLFAIRQDATIKSRVDGTLVFGTPLIAFGLQTALARDIEYGAAFSALALSFFYLLLAKILYTRGRENLRLLVEAFIALGVVFGTLAIPLGLDGRWTSAAWALEGAAIVWVGVRQEKRLARAFGLLLQFAAGLAFLIDTDTVRDVLPVFNSLYLGCVFVSVGGLFCSWYLQRHRERIGKVEGIVAAVLFCWGVLWWFGAGYNEIHDHVPWPYHVHATLLLWIASCVVFSLLERRLQWRAAKYAALLLLPLMYLAAAADWSRNAHPFGQLGFLAWPLAFAAHLWLLWRHEENTKFAPWLHAAGLWLVAAVGAAELAWLIKDAVQGGHAWQLIAWALVPGLLLGGIVTRGERLDWPVARHFKAYLTRGAAPLAVFLWLWLIFVNFRSNGDAAPLPYLPLFNPLDLAQGAALLALFAWFRGIRQMESAPLVLRSDRLAYVALGIVAFVWLNGVLLRTLHHWAAVPFHLDAMLRSMLVQAAFSIFWSVLALCTMFFATRFKLRALWLSGAGLMAVVVVKLFFVDLSNVGGIERIVSFIGVGLLMLVIGYVSPVPPRAAREGK